jgi:hypothetical protein
LAVSGFFWSGDSSGVARGELGRPKLHSAQTLTSQSSDIDEDEMQPPPHNNAEKYTCFKEIGFHGINESSQLTHPLLIYWIKSVKRSV